MNDTYIYYDGTEELSLIKSLAEYTPSMSWEVKDFVHTVCDVEGYNTADCVRKYKASLLKMFPTHSVFEYYHTNNLEEYIDIGKDSSKIDALIRIITKGTMSVSDVMYYYDQFDAQYKIFLQCYMFDRSMIPLKDYKRSMISICGIPVLNSPLINSKYIDSNYLWGYVYDIFYGSIKGESNYKKWVGYEQDRTNKLKRPNRLSRGVFSVTMKDPDQIPYLIDVMQSGISYDVKFSDNFITKKNMLHLINKIILEDVKIRCIVSDVKLFFRNAVAMFTDDERQDLDEYVLKLRRISKSVANQIAKNYKDSCEVYNGFRSL